MEFHTVSSNMALILLDFKILFIHLPRFFNTLCEKRYYISENVVVVLWRIKGEIIYDIFKTLFDILF